MEVNNEFRRVRAKLNLLQTSEVPTIQVLLDLLDVVADYHDQRYGQKLKEMWVGQLHDKYAAQLRKLNPDYTPYQKKLDL
jgi:hypothetical protein